MKLLNFVSLLYISCMYVYIYLAKIDFIIIYYFRNGHKKNKRNYYFLILYSLLKRSSILTK